MKTAPITGYAVFADGKRVTDVDSPSSNYNCDHIKLMMMMMMMMIIIDDDDDGSDVFGVT